MHVFFKRRGGGAQTGGVIYLMNQPKKSLRQQYRNVCGKVKSNIEMQN